MSHNFERAKARMNNLKAIEPLLSALRTLSMSTWQLAQNKITNIKNYEENYNHILVEILPHLEKTQIRDSSRQSKHENFGDTILLIVGSERGLCGKFNESLTENAMKWIDAQGFPSHKIWAMGTRLIHSLMQDNINFSWRKPLPNSNLLPYQQCYRFTQNWLEQYERYEFNQFTVLFNQSEQGQNYSFSLFKLLPYEGHHPLSMIEQEEKRFPTPIIETDAKGIYHQIIQHYIASSFYQIHLKSAIAEHAARFRLMEEAQENAEEIINEMNQIINIERKNRITQQMQELAAGAGLLDNK